MMTVKVALLESCYVLTLLDCLHCTYLMSCSLASHNVKAWKGTGAGFWTTSSPTVPSSLFVMRQNTLPRVREIWNFEDFWSTEHEKYMLNVSLSEWRNKTLHDNISSFFITTVIIATLCHFIKELYICRDILSHFCDVQNCIQIWRKTATIAVY